MAYLKDTVAAIPDFERLTALQEPTALLKAINRIHVNFAQINSKEPSRYDLLETYQVLTKTPFDSASLGGLPLKHLKRAPWVIFYPPQESGSALAEHRPFLSAYLRALRERSPLPYTAIITLAIVFLRYYPENKTYFKFLRMSLEYLVGSLETTRGIALRKRAREHRLFSESGPREFGSMLFESDDLYLYVAQAGFENEADQKGFVQSSVVHLLDLLKTSLEKQEIKDSSLSRIFSFLYCFEAKPRKFRFPTLRIQLAETLLLPYLVNNPPTDTQEIIQKFLLLAYGDPRLAKEEWHGVDEQAIAVLHRWLVHTTLQDFFHIVRKGSESDPDADRMWPYREAFWSAYLSKGVISDAWVVLGTTIVRDAKRFFQEEPNAYGRFSRGSGVRSVHAALIMRIGDLVVTEWNHHGKYRVWLGDNPGIPTFYLASYSRDNLVRSPSFEASHFGAEQGRWQQKLAAKIADWTGVKVTYREFMPR